MARNGTKRAAAVARRSKHLSARAARRAIIIDFEGRKAYKPRPDLIGIFDPFEEPDRRFYQVVLSERLAPAAKAGEGHAFAPLPAVSTSSATAVGRATATRRSR